MDIDEDAAVQLEDRPPSDEEEGEDAMKSDSSEEESDDEEEAKKVAEGFIVDDEEDGSGSEGRRRKRRKKKEKKHKKKKKRRHESDEGESGLDEDDLDLIGENTGNRRDGGLRRLQHRRGAEEDLEDGEQTQGDLDRIFEQEARRRGQDEDDLDDFIEEDFGDDEAPDQRQQRAKAAEKLKKSAKTGITFTAGMDRAVWEEVNEIFDCSEYEEALEYTEAEADQLQVGETSTAAELAKVFEPSALASRLLTAGDEAIRILDVPERMQLACRSLLSARPILNEILEISETSRAVQWISTRISPRINRDFLDGDRQGNYPALRRDFLDALAKVIDYIAIQNYDVPFIQTYRRDHIWRNLGGVDGGYYGGSSQQVVAFFGGEELWKVETLILRFRALMDKKRAVDSLKDRIANSQGPYGADGGMDPEDESYYQQLYDRAETVEEVSDVSEWLGAKYGAKLRARKKEEERLNDGIDEEGHDGANGSGSRKLKKAARTTRSERARSHRLAELAAKIAQSPQHVVADFLEGMRGHPLDDIPEHPSEAASAYIEGLEFADSQTVLDGVAELLAHDLALDPTLRKEIRRIYRREALISVRPTPGKGMQTIDEMHPYYNFKYLKDKPILAFLARPNERPGQFLSILKAESEHLVEVSIALPREVAGHLADNLTLYYKSDGTSWIADEWNKIRERIVDVALRLFLFPLGAKAVRETLSEDAEEMILEFCEVGLESRVNVAPFRTRRMEPGETPSVIAISNGYGDPKRDSIFCVYLDKHGVFREHLKLDNLRDDVPRQSLSEFVKRRHPHAVVVNGFSQSAHRLRTDVKGVVEVAVQNIQVDIQQEEYGLPYDEVQRRAMVDTILVHDDVARLYQHTDRAKKEFADVPDLIRYCVALARYIQSPLNEYAALGQDLTAITHHAQQTLLNKDTLLLRLERVLVNVVNTVGVDVNKAVHNPYYAHLLPYVAGLGPRKAQSLISQIVASCKGTLPSREVMITKRIVTPNIFMNCSSFLRIPENEQARSAMDDDDASLQPDILDTTRVHSEDYEIARKMAQDALELDEEDLQTLSHPSDVVKMIMDEDNLRKLDDLSLDDFARDLFQLRSISKFFALHQIKDEIIGPFADKRPPFRTPDDKEEFSMLTGETLQTLQNGFIIPVKVQMVRKDGGINVRLDSGVEGIIHQDYVDALDGSADKTGGYWPGRTIQALVIAIKHDEFVVELSTQSQFLQMGDGERRKAKTDQFYDRNQATMDKEAADAKNKKSAGRGRRMINHPNFHNFNSAQAEEFLANQQRGECVVRPSSKGNDHLALTWKVDTGVYQHLDVLELDKPSEYQLGRSLRVGGKYTYSDLDELIYSHVRAMAKKVEEMMSHDKFKGDEDSLSAFLSRSLMADPGKSVYGFAIDKRHGRAGNFLVGFRANSQAPVSTWPVSIIPRAFRLRDTEVPDMTSLCNSFKTQYIVHSAERAKNAGGNPNPVHGRTPYGAGGRTPLPYGMQRPMTNNPYAGGQTPAYGGYGAQTPRPQYGYR